MEARTTESIYVPRELFDVHIQGIKERADSDKELTSEKIDKLQAVIEKNFAELNSSIIRLDEKFQGQINVLNEKIDHTVDTLTVAIDGTNTRIDGLEKRIDDLHNSHNKWFTVFSVIFGVTAIAVAVIQVFTK